MDEKVSIVIVNYNNWKDTQDCLRSLESLRYNPFTIILVDNASTDESVQKIFSFLRRNPSINEKTHFVQAPKNGGFSYGNNLGIKIALEKGADYLWLLNNDTVVMKDTLSKLLECAKKNGRVLCGCKLIYYGSNKIQAFGGGKLIKPLGINFNIEKPCDKLDYITGASMFFHRSIVEEVGLLDEDYFLTWEDIDFSERAKKKGIKLEVCSDAIVFHKETVSIGKKSFLDIYCRTRNSLLFTKKNCSQFLPIVFVFNLLKILKGIKNPNYIFATIKAYKDFLRGNFGESSFSNR
jgi:GT2 family glycosyltransferase